MEDFNIGQIIGILLIVSLLFVVSVTSYIVVVGTANDYGLKPLNSLIEQQYIHGNLPIDAVDAAEDLNLALVGWIYHIDMIWLASYIAFSIMLFMAAYWAPRINLFSFSNLIYILSMFFLFMLEVIVQINDWFIENFLIKILPSVLELIPMFMWFLDNLGTILLIQLVLLAMVNLIDFDFSKFSQRKNKEEALEPELL